MKITRETYRLPKGIPSARPTDFVVIARVDNARDATEYTFEFKALFAANAIYAAIAIVSAEQRVVPAEVIVSHVAQRHATTGEMVKVL